MPRSRRGRDEGSVYFREQYNRWFGSISLGYGGDGKRRRRYVSGPTKKSVLDQLDELKSNGSDGKLVETSAITVGSYLQHWLDTTAKSEVEPTSLQSYEQLIRTHLLPIIGGIKLQRLERLHIEQLYRRLEANGVKAHARRAAQVVLTIGLNAAVESGMIQFNPAAKGAKTRLPKVEHDILNDAQAKQYLDAARPTRLYALFALALGAGLRQGELLGLAWKDIDFAAGTVTIRRSLAQLKTGFVLKEPKSKTSRRTISLPQFAIDALKEHRAAMLKEGNVSAPTFCTRNGTYIAKTNLVRKCHQPIIASANKAATELAAKTNGEPALIPEIRFHDLRHSHATSLLSKGCSIKAVSQRLGHSSIDITLKVYAHVLPADDGKLAERVQVAYG